MTLRNNGTLFASMENVNGDGYVHLVLHFERAALIVNGDLTTSTTELTLRGELMGGQPIIGSDAVRIVP